MSDTPTPAPEPVSVPVEHVLSAYADELAKATHRAIVAEATVTTLTARLAALQGGAPVASD